MIFVYDVEERTEHGSSVMPATVIWITSMTIVVNVIAQISVFFVR